MSFLKRRGFLIASAGAGLFSLAGAVLTFLFRKDGSTMETESLKRLAKVLSPKEHHWVGDGFYVSTILSVFDIDYKLITPFVLMDHADTKVFPPTSKKLGVGEHPHRGFETVTFAIQGEVEHRDSGGGGGVIATGGVQWMTAASGVVHDEFHSREFAKLGGEFSMVQLWVNLPAKDKMNKPRYQSLDASQFTEVSVEDGKATATLIAGEFLGYRGPAMTHTPINIFRLRALEECTLRLDMKEGYTTLLFVLGGRLAIQEQNLGPRDLAVFEREGAFVELSMTSQSELLVLNAEPIDEPIVHYGPFVMNTESEIRQAILDFQAGKMGTLVEESGS